MKNYIKKSSKWICQLMVRKVLPVALLLSSAPPSAPVAPRPLGPALGQEVAECRRFRRSLTVI